MYSCVRVSLMTSLIYIRFFFSLLFSSSFFAVANWCCACSWPRWSRPPRIPQTKRTSQATHRPPNPLNRAQIAFFGCILFHAISLNFIAAAAYIFLSLRVFCHVIECSFYSLEQTWHVIKGGAGAGAMAARVFVYNIRINCKSAVFFCTAEGFFCRLSRGDHESRLGWTWFIYLCIILSHVSPSRALAKTFAPFQPALIIPSTCSRALYEYSKQTFRLTHPNPCESASAATQAKVVKGSN